MGGPRTPGGYRPTRAPRVRVAARWRAPLIVIVSLALLAAALAVPPGAPGSPSPAAAAGPVSGAIGLGGGISGTVDERTGLFSIAVPVASIGGRGSAGIDLSLLYEQSRAVGGVDRSGFGPGWSLGVPFVNVAAPLTVYPANGGSYLVGGSYPSGLQDYPLRDLVFARSTGTLPARAGVPAPVTYSFTITHDEGRVDHFDGNGNLVARTDRFGNRTDLSWRALGSGRWAPTSLVDAYGLTTTFSYSTPGRVTVTAPTRADGVTARTVLAWDATRRVTTVTDPNGQALRFSYGDVAGSTVQLLSSVQSPAGGKASISYQQIDYSPTDAFPPLTAVNRVVTTDTGNRPVSAATFFSMNPELPAPGNNAQHNYAGYPTFPAGPGATRDPLFTSGSTTYQYSTELRSCVVASATATDCAGATTSTLSTYDSQHRLVNRRIYAGPPVSSGVLVQTQVKEYPAIQAVNVAGNYARPTSTKLTFHARSTPAGVVAAGADRTVATTSAYDDHGRVLSSTNETGATTVTVYDATFGLVASSTTTGSDGTQKQLVNKLSDDHKTIASSTTSSREGPGPTLAARSTTTYGYDDFGQPSSRTLTWADGAKPPGETGGPDSVTTGFTSTLQLDDPDPAPTRTLTTTLADGTKTVSVLDLVTGLPISTTDPLGRKTTFAYDSGGRQTRTTGPDGLATTTAYTAAAGTAPATRRDTTADGRAVTRTFDVLGRAVRVTDNVSGQKFVASPSARQLAAISYSVDGTTTTAVDQQGRTTSSRMDVLGRQVRSLVSESGIAHETAYDDVAHTTTRTVDPAGSAPVSMTRRTSYDDGNRQLSELRSYVDPNAPATQQYSDPLESNAYDGLGRMTSATESDLQLDVNYDGSGGESQTQKVTPRDPAAFPGDAMDLSRTATLAGQQTSSTRSEDDGPSAEGADLSYDAVGRIQTATDPLGRKTAWTYHDDGEVATRTSELGTVITNTYDDDTGQLTSVKADPAQGPTLTRTFTYVGAGTPGAGRVKSVTDESGQKVTLGYDADGHVVQRTYSDQTSTSASYGDTGLLATTTDVTGAVTSFQYDTAGRMQSATQRRGGTVLAAVTYTYDAMSRVQTTTRGNGTTTTNTYTGRNQIASQTTKTAAGALVESHAYTYDTHANVKTRTDTTPTVSACTTSTCPAPTTAGTWTTAYGYDAYDRLMSSATYSGASATGLATTATSYTLDVDGDVVASTTTTRSTIGGRPFVTTSKVANTIDDAGQLTARTTGSAAPVAQVFDDDGRLQRSATGAQMTYDALDRVTTATVGGKTTTYGYWPDGSRRQAITTGPGGTTPTTLTYHYGPDGTLVNDSTDDATTPTTSTATASYLITGGREARTLQAGTTATGTAPATIPAATTTGAGVGYVLRDRHSSVTALIDARGAVTNTYEYADYGAPALPDGRPAPATATPAGGRANPFSYVGAVPTSSMTDALTGHLLLPARSYDPAQGRFTTRDSANVFNRYQGFSANPIGLVDLSGRISQTDIIVDIAVVAVLALAAVVTFGVAAVAIPAVIGVEVGVTLATSAIVGAVAAGVSVAATVTGLAVAATDLADDEQQARTGTGFLSANTRKDLQYLTYAAGALGAIAGVASIGAVVLEGAGAAAQATVGSASWLEEIQDAADFAYDSQIDESYLEDASGSDLQGVNPKRFALVDGEQDDIMIHPGERITSSVELPAEGDDAASTAVLDGPTGGPAEPAPISQTGSRPIPSRSDFLRSVLGSDYMDSSDSAVLGDDRGLSAATRVAENADEGTASSFGADAARSLGTSPPPTAALGNWTAEADNGLSAGTRWDDEIDSFLDRDENITFLRFPFHY